MVPRRGTSPTDEVGLAMPMTMSKEIMRTVRCVLLLLGAGLETSKAVARRKFQVGCKVVSAVATTAPLGRR